MAVSIFPAIIATIIGILIGFKTEGLFVRKTRNSRAYLTPLGILIFGKNKGKFSEFVGSNKGAIIKMVDIFVGIVIGIITYNLSIKILEYTFLFYIPLLIISINSLFLTIRPSFGKMKWKEWLFVTLLYLLGFGLIYLIFRFNIGFS
jgi:hypothetical protein